MRKEQERQKLEKQRKLSEDYTKKDNNHINDEDYFYDDEYEEEDDDMLEGADHEGKYVS